jgi:predicted dehydrogenase
MAARRIALIGSRGHFTTAAGELDKLAGLQIVGISAGNDDAAPIKKWCAAKGHSPIEDDDYKAMLDRARPDIAIVAGPFEQHAEMCVQAIGRGIHVLTEKPAALTFEQLAQLRDACARQPQVHLAGMMFSRYDPGFYTAWKLIESGAIGEVRLIDARKSYKLGKRPDYYRDRASYGGTIPWVGSHGIDWIMWYARANRFLSVSAVHSTAHNNDIGTMERSAACQFTLGGGVVASLTVDYFRPANAPTHGDDWARVVGTTGVIEARPESVTLISADNDGKTARPVKRETFLMEEFVAHCEGTRKAIINRENTLALTDACLRARQSADEKRVVSFE